MVKAYMFFVGCNFVFVFHCTLKVKKNLYKKTQTDL